MLTAQERDVLKNSIRIYSPTEIEDSCIFQGTMLLWELERFEALIQELKEGNPVDKDRIVYRLNSISKAMGILMLELQLFSLLIEGPDMDPAMSRGLSEHLQAIRNSCSWEMREKYYYE